MKHILLTLFLFTMALFTCKAQTIKHLYLDGPGREDNVYYKDIDNDFNRFEGTWLLTNGTTTLTIILEKKVMSYIQNVMSNTNYYRDALVGEYRYVENGIEKINTLPNILVDYENPYDYNITCTSIF